MCVDLIIDSWSQLGLSDTLSVPSAILLITRILLIGHSRGGGGAPRWGTFCQVLVITVSFSFCQSDQMELCSLLGLLQM